MLTLALPRAEVQQIIICHRVEARFLFHSLIIDAHPILPGGLTRRMNRLVLFFFNSSFPGRATGPVANDLGFRISRPRL